MDQKTLTMQITWVLEAGRRRKADKSGEETRQRGYWKLEEDAKLTKAAKKHGNERIADAAKLPGRTNLQNHH
jgi:hypothetical protein